MPYRWRDNVTIDYWPGFTDALLSAMLVLIFVFAIFIVTQTGLVEFINAKEKMLTDLSEQLTRLEQELGLSKNSVASLQSEIDKAREKVLFVSSKYFEEETRVKDLEVGMDQTTAQLAEREADLAAMKKLLIETEEERLRQGQEIAALNSQKERISAELGEARAEGEKQIAELQARASQIAQLSKTIEEYLKQIKDLNQALSAARGDIESKDASLAELNGTVKKLAEQISGLTVKLGASEKQVAAEKLEIGKLLDEIESRDKEIASRDKEIEMLRQFEKYRSEFLAKLSDVFAGAKDIRVVGDRFVFQGEILFASGSDELTEAGKAVLRKFVDTYTALEPKIPQDMNVNIQVQGHTDIDPIVSAPFASNWELSVARATRVVRFLSLCGIGENRLSSAGFSQYYPVVADDTPEAKRQNRRIEILITRR